MKISVLYLLAFLPAALCAQVSLEGYVFEENNRGFLSDASVHIYQLPENYVRGTLITDQDGRFSLSLAPGQYRIVTKKDLFFQKTDTILVGAEKTFAKIALKRKPGYLFDATLAEARSSETEVVDAITGARVEIYNRTKKRPELVLLEHPNAFFQFTFEQGNHYTIMIRKPGYIAKRIESYVNVEGCILCVDGVREVAPGITENLTANNSMGTLLSNIELDKAKLDKRLVIRNIYYDFDKWDIRPDAAKQLDKVVTLMNDNPGLSIELGSHTDARGNDAYNDTLSQKRAEAAVEYIIQKGILPARISAKGYGETQLFNRCKNGVACSEEEHQQNRRTELRITAIQNDALEVQQWKSLEEIILEEEGGKKKKTSPNREPASPQKSVLSPQQNEALPPIGGAPSTPEIPADYSGYKIEVFKDNQPISQQHPLLLRFSSVFLQKDKNGRFCYFVGDFPTEADARTAFNNVIRPQFPDARLVRFKSGKKIFLK